MIDSPFPPIPCIIARYAQDKLFLKSCCGCSLVLEALVHCVGPYIDHAVSQYILAGLAVLTAMHALTHLEQYAHKLSGNDTRFVRKRFAILHPPLFSCECRGGSVYSTVQKEGRYSCGWQTV
jgi:hypothetical protein